ncbi:MAG: hypothetical protein ACOC5T_02280 [Elusimicrobiota bacterium]
MTSQKKISSSNEPPIEENGRTVVVRGPKGEVILSSSNEKDTIEQLIKAAGIQYQNQDKEVSPSIKRPQYME